MHTSSVLLRSTISCATACLFAVGCGARSPLPDLDSSEPSATQPQRDAGALPQRCIDPFPRTEEPDRPVGFACDPGAPPGAFGMFAVVGFELFGIASDGPKPLVRLLEGHDLTDFSPTRARLTLRGDFIAASIVARPIGANADDPADRETVLLTLDGATVTRFVDQVPRPDQGWTSPLLLSDRGIIALDRPGSGSDGQDARTTVIVPGGEVLIGLPGYLPRAAPSPDGSLLVERDDPVSSDRLMYWLDPCSGELRQTRESQREVRWGWRMWKSRLVYPIGDDATELVVEGAGGEDVIPLPASGDLIEVHPSGQALLATAEAGQVMVVDLEAKTARAIDIEFPPEHHSMSNTSESRAEGCRVASDGRLYVPLRDESLGQVFVSEDGQHWNAVEGLLPIGQVYSAAARETNGTFYLYGDTNAVTLPPWDPPPPNVARLDFNSVQVAREATTTGVVIVDHPEGIQTLDNFRLSRTGGCVSKQVDDGLHVWSAVDAVDAEVSFGGLKATVSSFVPGDDVATWW